METETITIEKAISPEEFKEVFAKFCRRLKGAKVVEVKAGQSFDGSDFHLIRAISRKELSHLVLATYGVERVKIRFSPNPEISSLLSPAEIEALERQLKQEKAEREAKTSWFSKPKKAVAA